MQVIRRPRTVTKENPRERRVLALCGDSQVGLSVLRSLAQNGLTAFAVCNSPAGQAAHSRYCSGAWTVERKPGAPAAVDQVVELARELDVGSIMPISESYHLALIGARDRLEPDIHVFSPSAEAFAKATDKDFLHGLCLELGIPVAKGMTLDKLMATHGDSLRYPLVLRTRRQVGDGAKGKAPWKAAYACNPAQLDKLHQSVRDFADNIIVQEYHSGAEDHVHVLMHDGELFMAGEYIGEHHMPLAGGVTVQRVSCHHAPLVRDAVKLLQAIRFEGVATAQFHYDTKTNDYIFLEINPRFCGGQPTVIMAGFHSPYLLWQSHFEPDQMKETSYRLGLRSRILGGDVNWMLGMIRGDELPPDQTRLSKISTVSRFVWNCSPLTRDDSFSLSDPGPFFADFKQMVCKRLLKLDRAELLDLS